MPKATNKTIEASVTKNGTKKDDTTWYRNAYKFEGSDVWYSHFIKKGTPLYAPGTVVKEIEYETNQYGGEIKSMVVGSMPAPGSSSGPTKGPLGYEAAVAKDYGKQHPIWMCKRWATDLQLARMNRLYPEYVEGKEDKFPTLQKLADEIVTTAWYMFTRTKALIEGRGPDPFEPIDSEPIQEPDMSPDNEPPIEEPPIPEDDIPF